MPYILIGLCLNEVVGHVVCCSKVWKPNYYISNIYFCLTFLCNLLYRADDAIGCDERIGHLDRQLRAILILFMN